MARCTLCGLRKPQRNAPSFGTITTTTDLLYFTDWDTTYGGELWRSDGTEIGTVLVKDINPGSNPSGQASLTIRRQGNRFSPLANRAVTGDVFSLSNPIN